MFITSPAFAQLKQGSGGRVGVSTNHVTKAYLAKYESMLTSTAKILVVDSIVCLKREMFKHIPLQPSVGKVYTQKSGAKTIYISEDEFGTRRVMSMPIKDGTHRLFLSELIDGEWTEPTQLYIDSNFKDIICPIMHCDGITLYFSASGGEESIGGYDIYSTVWDSEKEEYMRPLTMGLPYNSTADDYMLVIDEYNELGWIVTNRRVDSEHVCIYTFVPTESRESYTDITSMEDLRFRARLKGINFTQTDKKAVEEAKKRLKQLRSNSRH